ncbi:methyl-CpG-binding domain-containing protein 11-like [Durio zibethinus]|uniref:Methyl-CpG-binding domain-containing protein 11-like n=1 Tax=Durio zibethinus TaxID=66656 RepID=A0A6P5ZQJ9_DURZI|nr:methyl-CpG-binding domain-containing protein 11-like [Durio zibethinus]
MPSSAEKEMESGKEDVVCLELSAPPGWTKKFMLKKGGTPKRNEIIFTAPTGEELSNKRQLEQFLRANPGGPAVSEFDWGTGETPRRSARISEKVKAMPTPESEPRKKRGRKSLVSKKDNKESETAPEGTEETKGVRMEEAEKSEKENVEGEARKVAVKENENENKDKTQNADSKTESTSQEVKHGEDAIANMSTNIEEGNENVEAVSEKLNDPQDGVEADASRVPHKEKEGLEGANSQGKREQPVAEAEKGLGSGELDKPDVGITEERKKQAEGEEKVKHDRSNTDSEGAIKEKDSANCKEGQNTAGDNENNKKAEEAIQNGNNAVEV